LQVADLVAVLIALSSNLHPSPAGSGSGGIPPSGEPTRFKTYNFCNAPTWKITCWKITYLQSHPVSFETTGGLYQPKTTKVGKMTLPSWVRSQSWSIVAERVRAGQQTARANGRHTYRKAAGYR
jgi:hypothetical protein